MLFEKYNFFGLILMKVAPNATDHFPPVHFEAQLKHFSQWAAPKDGPYMKVFSG